MTRVSPVDRWYREYALANMHDREELAAEVVVSSDDDRLEKLGAVIERDDRSFAGRRAIKELGTNGAETERIFLESLLDKVSGRTRGEVIGALGSIGSVESKPVYVSVIQGDESRGKYEAINALAALNDPETGGILATAIENEGDEDIRRELYDKLEEIGGEVAIPAYLGIMSEGREMYGMDSTARRRRAAEALGEIGVKVVPTLRSMLDGTDYGHSELSNVISALIQVGGIAAISELVRLVDILLSDDMNDYSVPDLISAIDRVGLPTEESPALFHVTRTLAKAFVTQLRQRYSVSWVLRMGYYFFG